MCFTRAVLRTIRILNAQPCRPLTDSLNVITHRQSSDSAKKTKHWDEGTILFIEFNFPSLIVIQECLIDAWVASLKMEHF